MKKNPIEKEVPKFNRIRSALWPIHSWELKKFLAMSFLFFLIALNYHILRVAKDSLIVPLAGAEAIPFLKIWVMLPTAIFMVMIFTKFANKFNQENVFYVMMGIFLAFFIIFIFILYPNREKLFLNGLANYLQLKLPNGFNGLIGIIRYWMFSLFYAMSEVWGVIMLSLLAWGFANNITKICEAKRFYALFYTSLNISGIVAGLTCGKIKTIFTNANFQLPSYLHFLSGKNSWDQILTLFVLLVIAFGIITTIIHMWLHNHVHTNNLIRERLPKEKTKTKMSLKDSFAYIAKSKYLMSILIIVISYYIIFNITEVLWKSQMGELFPTHSEYAACMSKVEFYIGILATITSIFISGNLIRNMGWKIAALVTPITIMITGSFFFYFLFLKQYVGISSFTLFGYAPLALAVFFGAIQNCFTRAAKFNLFDQTKEMAFIPLSAEGRFKGKSTIDGIASRLGKTGGSILLQGLLVLFTTPIACAPYILIISIVIFPFWISSINFVSKKFKEKEQNLTRISHKIG